MTAYREYPPHPALAAHVACLWTMHARGPSAHRVLPDNCVDILWQDTGAPAFAVGMMSTSVLVPAAQPVRTVAVRFRPGAAALFLGVPLDELTDGRAALADLWGRGDTERLEDGLWGGGLVHLLDGGCGQRQRREQGGEWGHEQGGVQCGEQGWGRGVGGGQERGHGGQEEREQEQVWEREQGGEQKQEREQGWERKHGGEREREREREREDGWRIALIQRVLLARLRETAVADRTSVLGLRAVAAIEQSHGALRVEALADALHVSRQHLALQFRRQVGLSPKLFARICRFRRALALLRQRDPARPHGGDLAALAAECGYFDQSHLIRDFRDFAAGTPGGF